jgi:hypothetical protein
MTGVFRALTLFDSLTSGLRTFQIENDDTEPHLHVGEYAVIDPTDREIQNGELYLIQMMRGDRRIREVRSGGVWNFVAWGPSPTWIIQRVAKRKPEYMFGILVEYTVGGPWPDNELGRADLQSMMLGRVIGYSCSPIDCSALLAPKGESRVRE